MMKKNSLRSVDGTQWECELNVVSNVLNLNLEQLFNNKNDALFINRLELKPNNNFDIIQQSENIEQNSFNLIIWDLNFFFRDSKHVLGNLKNEEYVAIKAHVIDKTELLIKSLSKSENNFFLKFSPLQFGKHIGESVQHDDLCEALNAIVEQKAASGFHPIEVERLITTIGLSQAFDSRLFYSARSPYSDIFFRLLLEEIQPKIEKIFGCYKKVLVLDCDNTLYGGVIGETDYANVDLSRMDYPGNIYLEVQQKILELHNKGVVLCLCTKNEKRDVEEFFNKNDATILRLGHFQNIKANWRPKHENILHIADELNVGLDSIIFLDDSDFEIDSVSTHIPEVTTIKVPSEITDYPSIIVDIERRYFSTSDTQEDRQRQIYYSENIERQKSSSKFKSHVDYLASLQMEMKIRLNELGDVKRLAQLCQKTNQFNLTTIRHSEKRIREFMCSSGYDVISCELSDKFGESGITGLIIIKYEKSFMKIDTFLMSCRILGRDIERAFLCSVLSLANKNKGASNLRGEYRETQRNKQVKDFYLKIGMMEVSRNSDVTTYKGKVSNLCYGDISHIKVVK